MSIYFEAIPEDKFYEWKKDKDYKAHMRFVTAFMKDELTESFGLNEKDAEEVAIAAYNMYCEGNGETEYECIQKAYDEFKKN